MKYVLLGGGFLADLQIGFSRETGPAAIVCLLHTCSGLSPADALPKSEDFGKQFFCFLVLMYCSVEMKIRFEEAYLEKQFGQECLEYKEQGAEVVLNMFKISILANSSAFIQFACSSEKYVK